MQYSQQGLQNTYIKIIKPLEITQSECTQIKNNIINLFMITPFHIRKRRDTEALKHIVGENLAETLLTENPYIALETR